MLQKDRASLSGKVALVTGGGRGIGREIAVALADAGAAVMVVARSRDEVDETATMINGRNGRAIGLTADVTDRAAVQAAVEETEAELGPVDILVNNAGMAGQNVPLWETDPDQWWRIVEVNLRGPMLFARAVLPAMIARRAGTIINVGSYAGVSATKGAAVGSAYQTSKAALVRFTDTLAASTQAYNVRVFTISPGLVRTAMTEPIEALQSVPESKWSSPNAAAALVLRLASSEGMALNGRFIHIDDDLDELLREEPRIKAEDLYTLRLNKLAGPVT